MTSIIQRFKNIIKLSELEISPEKKEQISNIINEPPVRKAEIIKMRSDEQIIKELLNEK